MATKKKKPAAAKTPKKTAPRKPSGKPAKAKTTKKLNESLILAESAVRGILEKKGKNVVCLDLRGIENAVCEYFIICEGDSNTQVEAIAGSVTDFVRKELSTRPYRSEGWQNALWILIDYVTVIVHVFERDTRSFYNLESLWADAEAVELVKKQA
ncbi:MAG: iojap-like ribosome-associated protein [Bacteroidetes bacterium]|nr:MAG: iojap-like ribosome-associated protein [Bacteroidota bacterium]